jgi:hypothetical protein
MSVETLDEPAVTKIPDKDIQASLRAAEQARANPAPNPAPAPAPTPDPTKADPAPESAKQDDSGFNSMRDKLEAGLKEVKAQSEPKPQPAPTEPQPAKEEHKSDWRKLKEKAAEAEKRALEYEAKLKETDAALKERLAEVETLRKLDPKEFEATKAEKQKLQEQLEVVALEKSERFTGHFDKIFKESITNAKEAAGTEHAEAIEHLLQLPPSKQRKDAIAQIMEGIANELDKSQLALAVRDMDKARAERQEALANSKQNYAKLQEVEKSERERQSAENLRRTDMVITEVLNKAKEFTAFSQIEGDEAHNNSIKSREEKIAKYFRNQLSDSERVLIPVLAEEALHLRTKVVPLLAEENKRLIAALASLKNANPSLEGEGKPVPTNGEQGFISAFQQHWPGKQA